MGEKRRPQVLISARARRDLAAILERSYREFGEAASRRYRALIEQAFLDIQVDPERPGSRARSELRIEGARTWHISLSRARTSGARVQDPRHFVVYRERSDGAIEIARILHDSRDLKGYVPEKL